MRGLNEMKMNNRGQIAIFIILALIIIVLLALFFLLRKPVEIETFDENNPQAFIESCVRETAREAIEILSAQGGDIVPKGYMNYNDTQITYLCYTNQYYQRCIKQRPMLVEHIENQITGYITPLVENCFRNLELKLGKRYDLETSDMKIRTELYPEQVHIIIDKEFKMIRGDQTRKFNKFKINIAHPIYNFAKIAGEIANQETKFCNFDELGFMILYHRYDVIKKITGNDDIVYTLTERTTGEQFWFAIRNCVLPPGW